MIEPFSHLTSRVPFSPRLWLQKILFWTGAVLVAITAILFAKLSAQGSTFFFDLIKAYPFLPLLLTPMGFACLVWLTLHFFKGAEGSGIPQAIAAIDAPDVANKTSILSLRIAFGKVLLTTLALCAGASVGREGPTVQVGAAIMHKMGKWMKQPSPQILRTLILAGGAAGIAAAFNTPLAGIIFAIEELARSFEEKTSGTVLTTVIIAGIVTIAVLGNYSYFGRTYVSLDLYEAWRPVLICGLLGGLLGGGFSRFLLFFSRGLSGRIGFFITQRPVVFAGLCGLFIAILGQFGNNMIFGTGYDEARSLIEGTAQLPTTFGLTKMLATAATYISGIPGGLFAPSLAVGAGLGSNISAFMPDLPQASIIILGMIGYFTGVVQVPITATIIVMEMTADQSLTLPLMATAFLAYAVSRLICPTPLYRTLAAGFLAKAAKEASHEDHTQEERAKAEEAKEA